RSADCRAPKPSSPCKRCSSPNRGGTQKRPLPSATSPRPGPTSTPPSPPPYVPLSSSPRNPSTPSLGAGPPTTFDTSLPRYSTFVYCIIAVSLSDTAAYITKFAPC